MFDQLSKSGQPGAAFDENGNPKSRAELAKTLQATPGEFNQTTAAAQEARVSEIGDLQRTLSDADSALNIVTTPSSPNVVGPASGSKVGMLVRRIQAAAGQGDEAFESQRELERIQNNLVLGKTELLTGPISEKELAFLQRAVPTLTDTEKTWEGYLKEFANITRNQIAAKQANLKAAPGAKMPESSAKSARTPPASAPAQEDAQVVTEQQAISLPEGTPYRLTPGGTVYIAGQEP
jgi:hypothetical protein